MRKIFSKACSCFRDVVGVEHLYALSFIAQKVDVGVPG